ncbi:hypothetical protein D3C80_1343260 [compost metagenome]
MDSIQKITVAKKSCLILYCRQYEDDIEHCVKYAQRNDQTKNIAFIFAASWFPHQNQLLWMLMVYSKCEHYVSKSIIEHFVSKCKCFLIFSIKILIFS